MSESKVPNKLNSTRLKDIIANMTGKKSSEPVDLKEKGKKAKSKTQKKTKQKKSATSPEDEMLKNYEKKSEIL